MRSLRTKGIWLTQRNVLPQSPKIPKSSLLTVKKGFKCKLHKKKSDITNSLRDEDSKKGFFFSPQAISAWLQA